MPQNKIYCESKISLDKFGDCTACLFKMNVLVSH